MTARGRAVEFDLFAACAPGLEPWLADELAELGVGRTTATAGGVRLAGDDSVVYRVALGSGLATALRVRLGAFVARRFDEVIREVAALPWPSWIREGQRVEVKVTTRKSRLYHSTAVAERVYRGLQEATGAEQATDKAPETSADWTVYVRLLRDECTVSLDLTGEALYRRGYRLATAKAPLRPDLAMAILRVARWDPNTALIDPFCGSGTLCIEAAAFARRLPPGRLRAFAFMHSPRFDEALWTRIRSRAMDAALGAAPAPILGSDRDAGAVAAAGDNAARAGVDVRFDEAPLGRAPAIVRPPTPAGLWVSNPPYGRRTGDVDGLLSLYQSIGRRRRELTSGWRLALVVADPAMARATGVPMTSVVMTDHGGSKVRLMVEASEGP